MKHLSTLLITLLCPLFLSVATHAEESTTDKTDSKKQYEFLIGSWDCTFVQYQKDEASKETKTTEYPCNWNARYILDGHMVQDDFRMYHNEQMVFAGTTLRTWVDKKQRWDLAFLSAGRGHWPNFHGVWQDSEMMIDATGEDQVGKFLSRIRFKDIEKDSFLWEMHKSYDDGKTWALDSQIKSKRKQS